MALITSSRPARLVVRAQAAKTAAAPSSNMKALNVTKSSLVGSQGGSATRNVDGIVYTITYDAAQDKISIVDRVNRVEYDAAVGKDNRISLIEETGRPSAGGPPSFEQLQSVLRADGAGPELINARLAMAAFLGSAVVEVATGQPLLAQFASPVGAAAAGMLALAVTAASVAPALTGNVKVENLFPSSKESYANAQLPYFFTYLAEIINGRVAMLGLVGLAVTEHIRGAALF